MKDFFRVIFFFERICLIIVNFNAVVPAPTMNVAKKKIVIAVINCGKLFWKKIVVKSIMFSGESFIAERDFRNGSMSVIISVMYPVMAVNIKKNMSGVNSTGFFFKCENAFL